MLACVRRCTVCSHKLHDFCTSSLFCTSISPRIPLSHDLRMVALVAMMFCTCVFPTPEDIAIDRADMFFSALLITSTRCSKDRTVPFLPAAVDDPRHELGIFTMRLSAYVWCHEFNGRQRTGGSGFFCTAGMMYHYVKWKYALLLALWHLVGHSWNLYYIWLQPLVLFTGGRY